MSDWLVVLSEDNWDICRREGLLGLGRDAQRRLGRLRDGDRLWVYVNKRHVDRQTPWVRRIRALVRVTGPIRRLEHPPWRPRRDQTFPYARSIELVRSLDLPGTQLLRELSFARDMSAWGLRLLQAPLPLTEADVARLEAAERTAN